MEALKPLDLAMLVADECVVRPRQVKLLLGCSEQTANNMRKGQGFPRLREVGPGVQGYLKSELVAWLRATEAVASPVAGKGRGAQ